MYLVVMERWRRAQHGARYYQSSLEFNAEHPSLYYVFFFCFQQPWLEAGLACAINLEKLVRSSSPNMNALIFLLPRRLVLKYLINHANNTILPQLHGFVKYVKTEDLLQTFNKSLIYLAEDNGSCSKRKPHSDRRPDRSNREPNGSEAFNRVDVPSQHLSARPEAFYSLRIRIAMI